MLILVCSLREMGFLQTWAYPRTILGAHVTWEPLGSLGRYQGGSEESEEGESIEEVVIALRGRSAQYLDMEFGVPYAW